MENLASNFEVLKKYFLEIYVEGNGIYSKSPKSIYVKNLKEKDPVSAIFTLGYFINCQSNNNPNYFKGVALGVIFEQGIKGRSTHKESLKALSSEWMSHLNQAKSDFKICQDDFNQLKENFSNSLDEQGKEFEERLQKYESDFENISKTYDESLALQAPVKYWRKKSKSHQTYAILLGGTSLVLMIATACLFIFNDKLWGILEGLKAEQTSFWVLIPILFAGFMGIWIIRIVVKLFLSQVHLSVDATERRVMTNTYLSLLRKGQGLTETDKQLILQNLFRPSSSGIVKDDSMPPNTIEMLMRLFKK